MPLPPPLLILLLALLTAANITMAWSGEDGTDLRQLLTAAERQALLGQDESASVALVRPLIVAVGGGDEASGGGGSNEKGGRHRRAVQDGVSLHVEANQFGRQFDLRLRPSPALLSSRFAFLATNGNVSKIRSPDADLDEKCLYHGGSSDGTAAAVSLCGFVRGFILEPGNYYYDLQPLPERFHNDTKSSYMLVRRQVPQEGCAQRSDPTSRKPVLWDRVLRRRRESPANNSIGSPVHVETAVFVDRDLFQHMALTFPTDTERELVRFVLAMVNAVQLLYSDPSLGRPVLFALKRLEVLHSDPAGLRRSHDIDRFLSSFCAWQAAVNPVAAAGEVRHPLHWDHALILTGRDLYVVGKGGKISSQVVGLAPVAGMCSASSCTVNEGRHFESVYVVAHEIGHNLGMRHDGPLSDNECDPGSYLMSPTLGSGKTTWSACSRRYLQAFLQSPQARCLFDGPGPELLDHSAGGLLPGERFDADLQCALKYGRGARHAPAQPLEDSCRDLHCRKDRYMWTSHPALDGTACGLEKWCRAGRCVPRGTPASLPLSSVGPVHGGWSEWSAFSDCASGCLQDDAHPRSSTGLMVSTRRCNNPRPENGGRPCEGSDRRYRTCSAPQCSEVSRTSIKDFADQTCGRARAVQPNLVGTGLQIISSDARDSCSVWCHVRGGGARPRAWSFPDGTACGSTEGRLRAASSTYPGPTERYCVAGRCEEFTCARGLDTLFGLGPERCAQINERLRDKGRRREAGDSAASASASMLSSAPGMAVEAPLGGRTAWEHASGCYSTCVQPGSGLRLVRRWGAGLCRGNCTLQLCEMEPAACNRVRTPFEIATALCTKFRTRVRRLSGIGMQISGGNEDPDRPCRVACQDEAAPHRFYLVNGQDGWFPFGTDCSRGNAARSAFCVAGRCLDFGPDGTPLYEPHITLPLPARERRSVPLDKHTNCSKSRYSQKVINFFQVPSEARFQMSRANFQNDQSVELENHAKSVYTVAPGENILDFSNLMRGKENELMVNWDQPVYFRNRRYGEK